MSRKTTIEDASWSRRAGRRLLLAALASFLAVVAVAPASPHPAAAQIGGGLNLTLDASPSSLAPGQVVTFSYSASPPAVAPPFPSIQFVSVDFGDGQSSSGNSGGPGQTVSGSLTHVYNSPGTYTATLSAAATNGSSNTTTTSVSVGGGSGPSVSINASPSTVSVGQTVNFSYSVNTSVGIGFPTVQSILINYGDGAPLPLQSSSGTVGHTYNAPGFYTVTLSATSAGQVGSSTTQVNVLSGSGVSTVSLTASPQVAPAGQNINFTGIVSSSNSNAVTTSATIFFGDGQSQAPLFTGAGLISQHAYANPGNYTATLTVNDSTGQTAQGSATITATQASTTGQPPTNVQIVSGPASANVGQSANFIAATAVAQNSGASIASYNWSWGDGTSNQGQNTTHVYGSAGTFPITLTVTDSTGASAATSTSITIASALPQGVTVNFPSGWNLVGGPDGSIVSSNSGPLYTYQAGNTAYQIVQSGTALRAGLGYWAYFPSGGTVTLPTTNAQVLNLPLPAGQYIMISNPGNSGATVSGADSVVTYDPTSNGYVPATSLAPGQGAWAISVTGGTVVISSTR